MTNFIATLKKNPKHFMLVICTHILLFIVIIYCFITNIFNVFKPTEYTPVELNADNANADNENSGKSSTEIIERIYSNGTRYVNCTAPILYYSGYDNTNFGKVTGHYYYSLDNTTCTIYLLSDSMFKDNISIPTILENVSFTARLKKNDTNIKSLLRYMSSDIDWNYYSLSQCTGSIVLDQTESNKTPAIIIISTIIILVISNIFQIINIVYLYNSKTEEKLLLNTKNKK